MIIRIVKMTFRPEKAEEFLSLFNESKHLIRAFQGCTHLSLLRDENDPDVFFTYSYWDKEEDLNAYRESALFRNVWGRTKPLFRASPEARSLRHHTGTD